MALCQVAPEKKCCQGTADEKRLHAVKVNSSLDVGESVEAHLESSCVHNGSPVLVESLHVSAVLLKAG